MPLSENEQRILEEIERRLAEEDPRLVEQVTRTTLSAHLARRLRLSAIGFLFGIVMLLFVTVSVWAALAGFGVMVVAALAGYHYLKQLGRDQIRALQEEGRFSFGGLVGRIAARFRRPAEPPSD